MITGQVDETVKVDRVRTLLLFREERQGYKMQNQEGTAGAKHTSVVNYPPNIAHHE